MPKSETPKNEKDQLTSRGISFLTLYFMDHRLLYAMVFREDLQRLYPTESRDSMATPKAKRFSSPLLTAYPEWQSEDKLLFLDDLRLNPKSGDFVCTSRLTVGSKIGDGAHERVCRR